jgi:hypothetical protein
MNRRKFTQFLAAGCLAVAGGSLAAQDEKEKQEWGNLSVTFAYDGEVPAGAIAPPAPLPPGVVLPIADRSLLVDGLTQGIANIVVWLFFAKDAKPPTVHPSFAELVAEPVKLQFKDRDLAPRIVVVSPEQTLLIENADPIAYAPKGDLFANPPFAFPLAAGATAKLAFEKPESRPMPLSCTIRGWIAGYLVLRPNPYVAVSNRTGKLTIPNLPVGTHTFVLWHERAGYIVQGKRDGKDEQWKQGKLTVDIKPGDNDLGVISCKPEKRR